MRRSEVILWSIQQRKKNTFFCSHWNKGEINVFQCIFQNISHMDDIVVDHIFFVSHSLNNFINYFCLDQCNIKVSIERHWQSLYDWPLVKIDHIIFRMIANIHFSINFVLYFDFFWGFLMWLHFEKKNSVDNFNALVISIENINSN